MSDEKDSEEVITVNYNKIASSTNLLSVTRLLALRMMDNSYISVGDYIKSISESDLKLLVDVIDGGDTHPNFGDLLLLSEMLALGEGLEPGDITTMQNRTNQLFIMVICESLFRKKLIKLHHENLSFGEDMSSAIIAEKL